MKERIKEIVRNAYGEVQIKSPECNILTSEDSYLVIITCNSSNLAQENAKTMTKIKGALESELLKMKHFRVLENFIVMELFPFEYEGT